MEEKAKYQISNSVTIERINNILYGRRVFASFGKNERGGQEGEESHDIQELTENKSNNNNKEKTLSR